MPLMGGAGIGPLIAMDIKALQPPTDSFLQS